MSYTYNTRNDERRQDENFWDARVARIQLWYLIQARDNDEPFSAQELIHQVDTLLKIVEKHGQVLTLPSISRATGISQPAGCPCMKQSKMTCRWK